MLYICRKDDNTLQQIDFTEDKKDLDKTSKEEFKGRGMLCLECWKH